MDIRSGIIIAILAIAGTAGVMSLKHSSHDKNPPGCDCSPACGCVDCDCGDGRDGIIGRRELPPDAGPADHLGNGWVTFWLDVGGRKRQFIYNHKRGSLAELQSVAIVPGSPGSKPGAVGDSPPAK